MKPRLNISYTFRDYCVLVKSLFTKRKRESENFYVNHSRVALRIALSALNLDKGAGVGVMIYNCHTVFNAIRLAGYKPVFIDVTDDFTIDLQDLERKKNQISACVVTHLFGYINDIDSIKNICPNIPIIEDCAHAYLSEYNNKYAGDFGDIATFSIGHAKFPSVGSGGYIKVNNNNFLEEVNREFQVCKYPPFTSELKSILNMFFLQCMYSKFLFGLLTHRMVKKKNISNVLVDERESRICKTVFSLYKQKLTKCRNNKAMQNNTKEDLTVFLKSHFKDLYFPKVLLNSSYNDFMFPTLSYNRIEIINHFEEKGVELGTHFSKSIQWASQFGYEIGDCLNAEKISEQIVVFPTYYKFVK